MFRTGGLSANLGIDAMSHYDLRACTLATEHVAHAHDHHQLILATRGTTELAIEGSGANITASRGCLIPCDHHHDYQGDGRNRTFVLDIPLTTLPLVRDKQEIDRLFDRPRFFSVPPSLQQLAESLMRQLDDFPALHNEVASLLLRALYLHLEQDAGTWPGANRGARSLPQGGGDSDAAISERLDLPRLDAWIDRHLADEIRVEQLAALCALSPGHFHVCFRHATGLTPQSYVQARRLAHARTLVGHSELALGQVASLVGFCDQGSFSRAYRRHFGCTASDDRLAHRAGQAHH